jgi:hypothetical protein
MCDPVTLTVAATAVAALGQGYSALSANSQARYESKVAKTNAAIEESRARDALQRGTADAQSYQRKLSQEEGQQNAALAANGIDIGFGSAADVRADTARFGREDTLNIYKNAGREARGFEINSANYLSESKAAKARAKSALISGAFNIGSTVLGGATQVAKFNAASKYGFGV